MAIGKDADLIDRKMQSKTTTKFHLVLPTTAATIQKFNSVNNVEKLELIYYSGGSSKLIDSEKHVTY